ncbi:glutaredoxin 3 [Maricaulis sp. D1M11]|uniref:glutaredoxin 3 n=1 Tax=Maricaulis sp. D1M11 TaxID=3076117 RepID=UPI0039B4BC86
MSQVTIYTRPLCGYCARAVSLLKQKGVAFTEIEAGMDREKRQEMIQRSNGGNTFPQIFIGDMHIGGCDEMMALERAGKLDPLLNA